eukprot:6181167-Pleurochrysis_carterae.AAC.5
MRTSAATNRCTRGSGSQGVRGAGEGNRRSERSTADGAGCITHANCLPRLPTAPRELPLHEAQVQILPIMPPTEKRDAYSAQRSCTGREE